MWWCLVARMSEKNNNPLIFASYNGTVPRKRDLAPPCASPTKQTLGFLIVRLTRGAKLRRKRQIRYCTSSILKALPYSWPRISGQSSVGLWAVVLFFTHVYFEPLLDGSNGLHDCLLTDFDSNLKEQ